MWEYHLQAAPEPRFQLEAWAEALPRARKIADHDDPLRRKPRDDHPHSSSKVLGHAIDSLDRVRVSAVCQIEQVDEGQPVRRSTSLRVVA